MGEFFGNCRFAPGGVLGTWSCPVGRAKISEAGWAFYCPSRDGGTGLHLIQFLAEMLNALQEQAQVTHSDTFPLADPGHIRDFGWEDSKT